MKLLLYAGDSHGPGHQLQKMLEAFEMKTDIEIFRTVDGLSHELIQSHIHYDDAIAVLIPGSREDLRDLLSIRDILVDVRVVLILPDREKDSVSKGFLLCPRLVTYADGDLVMVAAVLKKMISLNNSNFSIGRILSECSLRRLNGVSVNR